jgi:hypothetical protein
MCIFVFVSSLFNTILTYMDVTKRQNVRFVNKSRNIVETMNIQCCAPISVSVMRKASAAGQQTRRVFGSMNAPADEDDSGSLDSDSDLLLDGEGSELLGSEEEDEELELGLDVSVNKDKHSTSRLHQEHSDDDF